MTMMMMPIASYSYAIFHDYEPYCLLLFVRFIRVQREAVEMKIALSDYPD